MGYANQPNTLMCGRFIQTDDPVHYAELLGVSLQITDDLLDPSWNVAPTSHIYVGREHAEERVLETMRWGFVPHWSKDGKKGQINARIETLAELPMFRSSYKNKRCLIPSEGYYEWTKTEDGKKQPHWIRRLDGFPLVMAGLWSVWKNPTDEKWDLSCAVVTRPAVGPAAEIHHRMPLVLAETGWETWLDRNIVDPEEIRTLAEGVPAEDELFYSQVSTLVNSVRNNGPELLEAPLSSLN